MSLTRIVCPECGAGLKSAAGFTPGRTVKCPKCQTPFTVEDPAAGFEVVEPSPPPTPAAARKPVKAAQAVAADAEDDDRPHKKKRPRDDEDEDDDRPRKKKKAGGYRTSPARFIVLGVLLIVLGVLGFLLYQKQQREKEDAKAPPVPANADDDPAKPIRPRGERPGREAETPEQRRAVGGLKQLALAMHSFNDATKALPPAAVCGAGGKPLLSWRVAILPYIEEEKLYKEFRLNEPWDSEHNKRLIPRMPRSFQGTRAAADGRTCFKVFVGGGSPFTLTKSKALQEFADGTSFTILIAEAGPPVEWTKPDDLPYDPAGPLPNLTPPGGDRILMATGDGAARWVDRKQVSDATLRAAITASGGEVLGVDW